MKYRIVSETAHRMRLRLYRPSLSREEAAILEYAFSGIEGVSKVTIYRATAGCALEYTCPAEEILRRLDSFRFENVKVLTDQGRISASEMRERKLDPALKRRLRMRVLAETVFDIVMPMPLQLGYHAYQMITLKDI